MLASQEEWLEISRCPRTKAPIEKAGDALLRAAALNGAAAKEYPIINGTPVLIDFSTSVISESDIRDQIQRGVIERKTYSGASRFVKRLLSPEKETTRRNVQQFLSLLPDGGEPAKVLVVAGGTIGQGMDPLYESKSAKVFAFDLYKGAHNQILADAHYIPAADDTFDAVVIQAVLEHTLEPNVVVAEIWRVLKPDGIVYAETPFMQQVHEGAYDFTRYTESGHRYLFKDFSLIASGPSGGPGIQFMWAADYLARSVFRSRAAGKIAKLAFFWTQYLDRIMPEKFAVDGASGVYFLGRKSQASISAKDIIEHYKGAQ